MRIVLLLIVLSVISSIAIAQTLIDIDGNVYTTVVMNGKEWMAENLRSVRYANGDSIGTTLNATKDVSKDSAPKYQWVYEGQEANSTIYGRMYTWYAVTDPRNVCPAGWHVTTEAEWRDLGIFLGGDSIAAGKLKTTGTSLWADPNIADNSTGFSAVPGGLRFGYGTYGYIGSFGAYWTSSEYSPTYALYRLFKNNEKALTRASALKNNAYSVRCVNGVVTGMKESETEYGVKFYPNPAKDMLHIQLNEINESRVISIYNLLGELIIQQQNTIMDLSLVPAGIYLLKIEGKNEIISRRLIIDK